MPVLGVCEEKECGDDEIVQEKGRDTTVLWLGKTTECGDKDVETCTRGDDSRFEYGNGCSSRGCALQVKLA